MLRVKDIMTNEVTVLSPDVSVREAIDVLSNAHVSGAPVVAGGRVIGVVSSSDLLAVAAPPDDITFSDAPDVKDAWDARAEDVAAEPSHEAVNAFFAEYWSDGTAEDPEPPVETDTSWAGLDAYDVSDVMSRSVLAVPSSADARTAAQMMNEHDVHRVLVIDDDQLVGIVSALDIAKAVAGGRFTSRTYVFNRHTDFPA